MAAPLLDRNKRGPSSLAASGAQAGPGGVLAALRPVALKRLASCSAKNHFYRANRDLGRVFKTEFLLSYLSEPQLRTRIRRGLLKVEQLHALARDVYYGRRGRINARELHEQMNTCSSLTLILACIIYWQAKEISQAVRGCGPDLDGLHAGAC